MNASARRIVGLKKFDHVSAIMRDELHWLRVPESIQFKLSLLSYKCLNGMAPDYLCTMYVRLADLEGRGRLRSAFSPDVTIAKDAYEVWTQSVLGRWSICMEQSA